MWCHDKKIYASWRCTVCTVCKRLEHSFCGISNILSRSGLLVLHREKKLRRQVHLSQRVTRFAKPRRHKKFFWEPCWAWATPQKNSSDESSEDPASKKQKLRLKTCSSLQLTAGISWKLTLYKLTQPSKSILWEWSLVATCQAWKNETWERYTTHMGWSEMYVQALKTRQRPSTGLSVLRAFNGILSTYSKAKQRPFSFSCTYSWGWKFSQKFEQQEE